MAIDLGKNRKYLKYALPPLPILVFVVFAAPNVLKDSNLRLLKNNRHFEREAPFQFLLTQNQPEEVQYEHFTLKLRITVSVLPEMVAIVTPTGTYTMQKDGPDTYSYLFNKVAADTKFHFVANGFNSGASPCSMCPLARIPCLR